MLSWAASSRQTNTTTETSPFLWCSPSSSLCYGGHGDTTRSEKYKKSKTVKGAGCNTCPTPSNTSQNTIKHTHRTAETQRHFHARKKKPFRVVYKLHLSCCHRPKKYLLLWTQHSFLPAEQHQRVDALPLHETPTVTPYLLLWVNESHKSRLPVRAW